MRCLPSALAAALAVTTCTVAIAQTPSYPGVGRTPTVEEIRAVDIAVSTDGKELPPGSGSAKQGAAIYAAKCASCHGPNGEGQPREQMPPNGRLARRLVGGQGTLTTTNPVKTVGSYYPFATTLWDYIRRAMPPYQEESLTPDEVYALTALLLHRNGIVGETDVLDARTLPKVQMPNRNGFVPPRIEDIAETRKRGCRLGTCP